MDGTKHHILDTLRRPHVVFVAGPGRSGTSTMAGVLRRLGVVAPTPEVPPNNSNPRGFNEPLWVVHEHERLLRQARITMHDPRPSAWHRAAAVGARAETYDRLCAWLGRQVADAAGHDVIVKDPRLVWFLDAWIGAAEAVGAAPSTITMVRSPAAVVASKQTYYNRHLSTRRHLMSWLNLMLHTELLTRGMPRAFVSYDDLLDDWRGTVRRVQADLHLRCALEHAGCVDHFVDPHLRRSHGRLEDLHPSADLTAMLRRTGEALLCLADPARERVARDDLDRLRDEYASCCERHRTMNATAWAALGHRTVQQALGRV